MQNAALPFWAKSLGYFFGAGLIFIGARFLILPETAELGFGLLYVQPNESFHYIKGIRDLTFGLLFTAFTIAGWRKPLGAFFLIGSLTPIGDMIIVLTAPAAVLSAAWIHGLTALAAWIGGYFLLRKQE